MKLRNPASAVQLGDDDIEDGSEGVEKGVWFGVNAEGASRIVHGFIWLFEQILTISMELTCC